MSEFDLQLRHKLTQLSRSESDEYSNQFMELAIDRLAGILNLAEMNYYYSLVIAKRENATRQIIAAADALIGILFGKLDGLDDGYNVKRKNIFNHLSLVKNKVVNNKQVTISDFSRSISYIKELPEFRGLTDEKIDFFEKKIYELKAVLLSDEEKKILKDLYKFKSVLASEIKAIHPNTSKDIDSILDNFRDLNFISLNKIDSDDIIVQINNLKLVRKVVEDGVF